MVVVAVVVANYTWFGRGDGEVMTVMMVVMVVTVVMVVMVVAMRRVMSIE